MVLSLLRDTVVAHQSVASRPYILAARVVSFLALSLSRLCVLCFQQAY